MAAAKRKASIMLFLCVFCVFPFSHPSLKKREFSLESEKIAEKKGTSLKMTILAPDTPLRESSAFWDVVGSKRASGRRAKYKMRTAALCT